MKTLRLSMRAAVLIRRIGLRVWPLCLAAALSACGGGGDSATAANDGLATTTEQAAASAPSLRLSAASSRASTPAVSYVDGRLNVRSGSSSPRAVLAAIEQQAGISIVLAPSLASPSIAGDVTGASLVDGLLQLLGGYDVMLSFGAADSTRSALQTVWVYPKDGGPRRATTAAPAAAAAANDVLQAADDAILADRLRRELLSLDPAIRRDALSRGLDKEIAMPESALQQLASADADPATRRLALSAMQRNPALDSTIVRATAQLALQDNDPQVREQAKGLLEQMDMAALSSDMVSLLITPQQLP